MSAVARRYYSRGMVALQRSDLEGAIESFRAAIDLSASFSSARIGYAVALVRYGDAPRAAQILRAGLARRASNVAIGALWATLGDALTAAGDFFGAEDAFRQAAAQHESFAARSASGLARVYAKLGRYVESFEQLGIAAKTSKTTENSPS